MDFIDYYAVLNLSQEAKTRDVQKAFEAIIQNPPPPEVVEVCTTAYVTLINPYKRARYDKLRGYLMVIQIMPAEYLNAVCYEINSIQPYASMHSLIEKFKNWIQRKYDFDWTDAQQAHYSYHLESKQDNTYLLLRFPHQLALESFSKYLQVNKLVKTRI